MSQEHLLAIATRWKNEAYQLSKQLKLIKHNYQRKPNQFQHQNNSADISFESSIINNENLFKYLLRNVDQSSISDQLSVLCHFFADSLQKIFLSNLIEEKNQSVREAPLIIENIQTNVKQIGELINQMNENCSNILRKN